MFPEGTRTVHAAAQRLPPRHHADRAERRRRRSRPSSSRPTRRTSARAGRSGALPPLPVRVRLRLGERFAPARHEHCERAAARRSSSYFRQAAVEAARRADGAQPACAVHASRTHLVLIPSYNTGRAVCRDRARGARALGAGLGRRRRQHRRHRRAADAAGRRATPACACWLLPQNRGKGAAVLHGLPRPRGRRLHACADDGLRRPAPGRPDPRVHGRPRPPGPTRWCSAGRCSMPRAAAARARPAHLELLDQPRDARAPASAIRCTAFASTRSPPLIAVMRAPAAGCAASTSTPRRWCGSPGAASSRSTSPRRSST